MTMIPRRPFVPLIAAFTMPWLCTLVAQSAQMPREVSGIYPHLAMYNNENECGTGAVVPWADSLWVVTYAPHAPRGSSDKLYQISTALDLTIRPESIGGTPANRMIHRESNQLFIGPYAIDARGKVRAIPFSKMFGRPTANARHLTQPASKIYFASMEEALYEVDVRTLDVTELWADEEREKGHHADLPGYHGKGLYSGQGRIVYANNGEHGRRAQQDPTTESGVLAQWDGKAKEWTVVRRCQFTEVTGPNGIYGADNPETDPIWAIGWDHRSLILQVLDSGEWSTYRLPKGSHSYDGAHGWNTEWPRIRDIGESNLLMTMHGLFWHFPKGFRPGATAGIEPRSAYLKVVGDFCRWGSRIVLGCDDAARNEFLNKRRAKGEIAASRSHSNLWFLEPAQLDSFGPVRAVGGLWMHENVAAGAVTDPFLIRGFDRRGLHMAHSGDEAVEVVLEVDQSGDGTWSEWKTIKLEPKGYRWVGLPRHLTATWLRARAPKDVHEAVLYAHFADDETRGVTPSPIFKGLATDDSDSVLCGLVRSRGGQKTSMAFAAMTVNSGDAAVRDVGCYELDSELVLAPTRDAGLHEHTKTHTAIPEGVLTTDAASVVFVDDAGARWRLPNHLEGQAVFGNPRVDREVVTERDLFHAAGTFYELPAINAGGFEKIRPVSTHDFRIHDYCSYRGLLVMTGVSAEAEPGRHIVRSKDGDAGLWVGSIDDLWQLGKPRGHGGPWYQTSVQPGVASDPYLMTGYDKKELVLTHDAAETAYITMEADLSGDGRWTRVRTFDVPAGKSLEYAFPEAWSAYWVRFRCDRGCRTTAQLTYK